MGTGMEYVDMDLELAEGNEISCNHVAELLLKRVLQGRPVGAIIVVLVDNEL